MSNKWKEIIDAHLCKGNFVVNDVDPGTTLAKPPFRPLWHLG